MPEAFQLSVASTQKVMAFDFGTSSIGVAIGQSLTKTATPLKPVPAKGGTPHLETLTTHVKTWAPDIFVVGSPLNMDGTTQKMTKRAKLFGKFLKTTFKLPTFFCDERLTTASAKEALFAQKGFKGLQKGVIDSYAAKLILEHWLNEPKEGVISDV